MMFKNMQSTKWLEFIIVYMAHPLLELACIKGIKKRNSFRTDTDIFDLGMDLKLFEGYWRLPLTARFTCLRRDIFI